MVSHFRRVLLNISHSNAERFCIPSSNVFGLVNLGLKELSSSGYIFIPLDKQPGYVLVSPAEFSLMEELALPDKYYIPWPVSYLNFGSIIRDHARLVSDIGEHHQDPRLARNITSSVFVGTFACPLSLTVKAHKVPGCQGIRTIHRGFNPCFGGLSAWLVKILQPYVEVIPWSHKDTFSVHRVLSSFIGTDSTIVAKVDLKDFFLSGESHCIATSVSSLVQDERYLFLAGEPVCCHVYSTVYL